MIHVTEEPQLGLAAANSFGGQDRVFLALQGIDFVVQPRRGKSQRSACFANRPQVGQPVQRVLALLQAQFVAKHTGLGLLRAAKTPALITDDWLDGRQQLGRRHQRHRDSRAFENSFDDLAVAVVGDNGAIFDGVSTDNAAGRHMHIEDGIAGGGKLVHQLTRRSTAVEHARIAFLDDHHAGALDAIVPGIHRSGNKVGEAHVGDEAAALLHVQQRLLAVHPFRDTNFAAQHAGIHANVGNRLGKTESPAIGMAIFAGCGRRGQCHVVGALLWRATLVDRRQGQASRQAASGGAGIHPGQLKRNQGQSKILGPNQVAAVLGIHEDSGDSGLIESLE